MTERPTSDDRGMKLHNKILLGLAVGAVAGVAANLGLGADHRLVDAVNHYLAEPVGQIFLRMLAPFGVAGLIFTVASQFGFDLLAAVAACVGTVLAGLALHVLVTLAFIVHFLIGVSPPRFFLAIKAALVSISP